VQLIKGGSMDVNSLVFPGARGEGVRGRYERLSLLSGLLVEDEWEKTEALLRTDFVASTSLRSSTGTNDVST
jgi:hypothetical protein